MVNRDRSLAAATATALTAAVAFSTTAVVQDMQFIHGFHLLSYRYVSIKRVKKIGGSVPLRGICSPILLVNNVDQLFCRRGLRCKLNHQLSAADHNIFLIECVECLLAFFANAD